MPLRRSARIQAREFAASTDNLLPLEADSDDDTDKLWCSCGDVMTVVL